MVFSALNIGTEHTENTERHGFVGIIVPSLWGGLGRGLTLLVFSGGHIGPHPTKRLQRTGHAQSLLNSLTPDFLTPKQGTRKGCPENPAVEAGGCQLQGKACFRMPHRQVVII